MKPAIVVFGAQTSRGALVARQYGNDGYDVVLVAEHAESLSALITILTSEGVYPQTFIGPLASPEQAAELIRTIRVTIGPIDALFYSSPSQPERYLDEVESPFDLTLASIVREVLPQMRARRTGTLLVAPSLHAEHDSRLSATHRYLQFLQRGLVNDGVHISTLTVGSLFCQEHVLPLGLIPEDDASRHASNSSFL